jgi:hypothetical protein
MAIKAHINPSRAAWGNATAAIGQALLAGGATGVTGFKAYKNVDQESVGPVLRSYVTAINAQGLSGAGHVPVIARVDHQRIPTVIKQCCAAANIIHP